MRTNNISISQLAEPLRISMGKKRPKALLIDQKMAKKNFFPAKERNIKSPFMGLFLSPQDILMHDPTQKYKSFCTYYAYVDHLTINNKRIKFGTSLQGASLFGKKKEQSDITLEAFEHNKMPDHFSPTALDIGTFILARRSNGFDGLLRLFGGIYHAEALTEKGFLEESAESAEFSIYARALVTFEHSLNAVSSELPVIISPFTNTKLYHFSFENGEALLANLGEDFNHPIFRN